MGERFILPESRFQNSPSSEDNLLADDEYDLRNLGCEFIQSSGLLLRLPQTAIATAQVLFHRFYYSKSFVRYPFQYTAMACIVLASKIEEAPKSIGDVVLSFHKLYQLRKDIIPVELNDVAKYRRLKSEVVRAERRILKELGFFVYVNHPHKFIISLCNLFGCVDNQEFVQTAWSYMNDSLRTDVFLRYLPETIACACLYLSARVLAIPLPELPPWWEVFLATEDDIKNICKIILKLYTRPKPDQDRLENIIDKLRKEYENNRAKVSLIKQFNNNSTNDDKATESPTNQLSSQIKKIKVEHIIQIPDNKRQKQSIDSKEDIDKRNSSVKKINDRNGDYRRSSNRSPSRRSRSRSIDNSRKRNRDYDKYDYKYDNKYYDKYADGKYDSKYDKYDKYDSKYDKYQDSKYNDTKYDDYYRKSRDRDDKNRSTSNKDSMKDYRHKSKY